MDDEIPVFPVAALTVGPVPRLGVVLIRFDYLSSPLQAPEEATTGLTHALTRPQAIELGQRILSALQKLGTDGSTGDGSPRH